MRGYARESDFSGVDYSLASAASSTLFSPCTNRPVKCAHCELVIASYSMQQHYRDKHPAVEMPTALASTVELAKHERDHVMQKLTKHGSVTSVCSGPACCPPASKKQKR